MGREARKVPANWQHPKDSSGHYVPLFGGSLSQRLAEWEEGAAQWAAGFRRNYLSDLPKFVPKQERHEGITYEKWAGAKPEAADYMPDWSETERTHYQMYETCSEGTPISPVMETPEALADWLFANCASFFGDTTASRSHWFGVITGTEIGLPVFVGPADCREASNAQ